MSPGRRQCFNHLRCFAARSAFDPQPRGIMRHAASFPSPPATCMALPNCPACLMRALPWHAGVTCHVEYLYTFSRTDVPVPERQKYLKSVFLLYTHDRRHRANAAITRKKMCLHASPVDLQDARRAFRLPPPALAPSVSALFRERHMCASATTRHLCSMLPARQSVGTHTQRDAS